MDLYRILKKIKGISNEKPITLTKVKDIIGKNFFITGYILYNKISIYIVFVEKCFTSINIEL